MSERLDFFQLSKIWDTLRQSPDFMRRSSSDARSEIGNEDNSLFWLVDRVLFVSCKEFSF